MEEKIICADCGRLVEPGLVGTGYGIDRQGKKVCYSCCGVRDKKELLSLAPGGKMYMYMSNMRGTHSSLWADVGNWCGTFKVPVYIRKGVHNIAHVRYDAYFEVEGLPFWACRCGDNTEICFIKRLKHKNTRI